MQLENSNSIMAIKSTSNEYLRVSRGCAEMVGFQEADRMQGLNDRQILDYSYSSEYYNHDAMIEDFILEDEVAFRGESLFVFSIVVISNKPLFLLFHKHPYVENNKIVGCQFQAVHIPNNNIQTLKSYLSSPDIIVPGYTKKYFDVFQLVPSRKYKLSKRELECIQLLTKGYSAKTIAYGLRLSQRTIESYIRNIKDKLNVSKTAEIVALAVSEGIV